MRRGLMMLDSLLRWWRAKMVLLLLMWRWLLQLLRRLMQGRLRGPWPGLDRRNAGR